MNEGAYWLARARAGRIVADEGDAVVLRQAVSDVELRAVGVVGPEGTSAVLVRWGLDVEPVSGVLTDPDTHRGATSSQLLVLGAALRLCWSDPSRMPYPGGAVADREVIAACAVPGSEWVPGESVQGGQTAAYRRALRELRAFGYLAGDRGDGLVRLGPMVAAWSERDVAELRRGYGCLPCPVKE